jgi:hypothetical protein
MTRTDARSRGLIVGLAVFFGGMVLPRFFPIVETSVLFFLYFASVIVVAGVLGLVACAAGIALLAGSRLNPRSRALALSALRVPGRKRWRVSERARGLDAAEGCTQNQASPDGAAKGCHQRVGGSIKRGRAGTVLPYPRERDPVIHPRIEPPVHAAAVTAANPLYDVLGRAALGGCWRCARGRGRSRRRGCRGGRRCRNGCRW